MDAFPAFIPLAGRRVLVVGDGDMAEGKAELFKGSPAVLERRPFGPGAFLEDTYAGADIVFIVAPDEAHGRRAARAARAAGAMLVNVVDRPALCDFYTPAIVDRGAVVAAVGTTGSGPVLSQRLKTAIAGVMPEGLDGVAALLKEMQADVRRALPEFTGRRAFLSALLDGPAAAAALAGRAEEARALGRRALQVHVAAAGFGQEQKTDQDGDRRADDGVP